MPSDDEGGDDLSVDLSDLSISEPDLDGFHDGLEAHANEPSSWDQVDVGSASEAARRLADISSVAEPSAGLPAQTDAAAVGAEPRAALDYTGRATLALDVPKMCQVLYESAQKNPQPQRKAATSSVATRTTTRTTTRTDNADHDASDARGVADGNDSRRTLSLTTSTMKSVEKRILRQSVGGSSSATPNMATTSAADVAHDHHAERMGERHVVGVPPPGPLHVDPKVFLRHVHQNKSLQDLETELETIEQEHARGASAIHDLVCTHFGQFISCKNTIGDIRSALRRNEADATSDSSATKVLLAAIDNAIALATMRGDALADADELAERNARAAAARRALAVSTHHRALLSLPEMLREQTVLREWDAMAHNVVSARLGIGQKEATLLLKVLSECESNVAEALRSQPSASDIAEKSEKRRAGGAPLLLLRESEKRDGQPSRWKRIQMAMNLNPS